MKRAQSARRVGFTLSELLVVVALVAIGAAIALSVKKEFTKSHFSVQQLGFSADGGRLLAMSHDGEVKAWDAVSGKQVGSLQPSPLSCPKSAISSDGRTVARLVYKKPNYAYQDGFHLDVFDIETGKRLSRRSRNSFDDLAFSPDGKLLTVWSNNAIELFDPLDAGEAEFSLPPEKSERPKARYWSLSEVTFGLQRSVVYAINSDDELFRWDIATGEQRRADIVLPLAKGSTSKLAVSPDGRRLAILKYDAAKPLQPLSIELRDAGSLSVKIEETLDSQPSEIAGFAFADFGKSLVVLGDDLEFFDSETLEQQKQRTQKTSNRTAIQSSLYGGLAVGPNGKRLALADLNAIDLYEDGTMRRLVDDSFSGLDFFLWLLLFNAVMMLFFYMRRRNKTKTCSQCGKDWIPVDRSRDPRCPDCRLLAASTDELRRQQQKTKHQVIWRLLALLPVIVFLPLIGRAGNLTTNPLDYLETFFGTLLVVVFYGGGGLAIFFVVSILANHWRIRRLRSVDRSLARAQKAASSTGRIDEFGPITLWTDAAEPLSETAESIAGRLASCRWRIEELTGEACPPVRPLLLLAFSTSAAARRYSPVPRFDPDRNSLYLGPYANQGFFSLEMARRLVPLSVITGGLLMPHCLKPAKKGLRLWWNLGLGGFLAVENLPSEPSDGRRKLAVWHSEHSCFRWKSSICRVCDFSSQRLPQDCCRSTMSDT